MVINEGIGDSDRIVRQNDVGIVLPGTGPADFECALHGVRALLANPDLSRRCRKTAEKYFDLADGVAKYAALYAELAREGTS